MTRYAKRRDKLGGLLRQSGLSALLVSNPRNVSYLTGFTGEDSYLLLTERDAIVFSDPRFEIQLREECPDVEHEIRPPGTKLIPWTVRGVHSAKIKRLGIEGTALSVSAHGELAAEAENVQLVTTNGLVEELRAIKDREEIDLLRQAGRIAERGFAMIRAGLRPDQEEREIAHDLEHAMRRFGATGCAFPSIIAVGDRAALPHYRPGTRRVEESGLLLVDWGAEYQQYRSDLTRVLVTGKISPKLKRVYEVVLAAQAAGIAALRPGAECEKVDAAARAVIDKAGFGKYFSHGLGHGIGLDIHEAPRFGPKANGKLVSGMVVTVEPGVYLAGVGGVRIEDDVLITKDGHEVLTHAPKEWEDAQLDVRLA